MMDKTTDIRTGGAEGTGRSTLDKSLGSFGFFALAFGSMIGVGWVTAAGGWLEKAGPLGAILAFLAGGAVMLCIGFCYAEATPMLPLAGGEVAYAYKAFGTAKAFLVGWCLAFGYITISGFEAISIGKVLSYMLPHIDRWPLYQVAGDTVYGSHLLLALVCTGWITWLHYRGAKNAAAFQNWLTITFVAITVIFIVAGFATGEVAHLTPLFASTAGHSWTAGFLAVFVTVPFWFVGFDTIPQGAEEANASVTPRKLAFLIIGSIAAAILFYVVLILSISYCAPREQIVGADLPAAAAFEAAFSSKIFVNLVLGAALLGLFTSWNGFFLAGSRVLFSLGRGRIIPESLGRTHPKFHTPHRAVLLTGLLTMLAPFLGRKELLSLVNAGSLCIVVAFLGVALSVMRLRRTAPNLARPYRIPGGRTIPLLAIAGSLMMLAAMVIPGSPAALAWPQEIIILVVFAVVGGAFWVGGKKSRYNTSEADRAYLILEHYAEESGNASSSPKDASRP
jgi:basic amino acid/polyamine antiporter, APA family